MKKQIVLVLVLALCVTMMAACTGKKPVDNGATVKSVIITSNKSASVELGETEGITADAVQNTDAVTSSTVVPGGTTGGILPTATQKPSGIPTAQRSVTAVRSGSTKVTAKPTAPKNELNPVVKLNDSRIRQLGRNYYWDDVLYSAYTAAGIEFRINGTGASATMLGMTFKPYLYLAVYVDGVRKSTIAVNSDKVYKLCSGLPSGVHTIKLMKVSEMNSGSIVYSDLRITGKLLAPPAAASRKIEFYGDSITCGLGVYAEGITPNVGNVNDSDGLLTYAGYTANAFAADYNVISKSGAGIIRDGVKQDHGDEMLITDLYDNCGIERFPSPWKFSKFTPDVVVINLGTNDSMSGRIDTADEFVELRDAIRKLLGYFHSKYPKAKIVWAYGMIEDGLNDRIKSAVESVGGYAHYFKLPLMSSVSAGHPSYEAHQEAGRALTKYLKTLMGW